MNYLDALIETYSSQLHHVERRLNSELSKISPKKSCVLGYTSLNSQEVAYLQGATMYT